MLPRRPTTIAILGILLPLLAACGSSSGGPASSSAPATAAAPPPALVQVENNAAARPQWGLQDATVVYEYVTEGGISRFSAIYTTPPQARIGPVRSARLVTIHLAKLYGAVVVYSGASTAVQQALDSSGVAKVDEQSAHGALFRIGGRQAPHNLVTDGSHLATLLDGFRGRTTPPPSPTLWPRSSGAAPSAAGKPASRVTVPVSDSETPTFTWDAAAGGWRRSEPDTGSFVDANSNRPVTVATLIVQQVNITTTADVEDVNGAHGVDITLTGSGPAQVFTGGNDYDATWNQPGSGPPSFTMQGGAAAPIAPGLVWICLVPSGSPAAVS